MSKLRIFLADDQAVIRAGLKRLIEAEPDLKVVGEAGTEEETISGIGALRPAVALVDVSVPGLNAPVIVHRIRQTSPQVKIVVLTAQEDPPHCRALLEAGAAGYVLKRATANELIQALRAANRGEIRVDPRLALLPGDKLPAAATEPVAPDRLSDRELAVLRLIAQGYSNKEIASQMDLSTKTIETYKTRSMEKLHLRSRVDIVRHAIRQGWLGDA